MNGEYLFEVVTGLRMAVFMDAGKVFPRWQQLNFSRLEKNYGFGFRGGAGSGALRLDFGFSREGVQAWLVFDNVF
jgi:outer membrane translocation and assembly module TamA